MGWHLPAGAAPEPAGPYKAISYADLLYIAQNLRAVDQEEIYNWNGQFGGDPEKLAYELYNSLMESGHGRVVVYDGKPAAWIGLIEVEPGVWQVTMGGTIYLPMVGYYCMAWARWSARETKHNGKILYCDSREGHAEAHKMLLSLGAKVESVTRIGYDGGKYYRFFWRYGENDQDVSQPGRANAI